MPAACVVISRDRWALPAVGALLSVGAAGGHWEGHLLPGTLFGDVQVVGKLVFGYWNSKAVLNTPIFGEMQGTGTDDWPAVPERRIKMYPINWTRKFLFYTHKSWIPQSCGHTSCKFIATTPLFWWLVPFLHRMYIHISFPFHRWCDIVISMKWRKTL